MKVRGNAGRIFDHVLLYGLLSLNLPSFLLLLFVNRMVTMDSCFLRRAWPSCKKVCCIENKPEELFGVVRNSADSKNSSGLFESLSVIVCISPK